MVKGQGLAVAQDPVWIIFAAWLDVYGPVSQSPCFIWQITIHSLTPHLLVSEDQTFIQGPVIWTGKIHFGHVEITVDG